VLREWCAEACEDCYCERSKVNGLTRDLGIVPRDSSAHPVDLHPLLVRRSTSHTSAATNCEAGRDLPLRSPKLRTSAFVRLQLAIASARVMATLVSAVTAVDVGNGETALAIRCCSD
jgi:hypothetical protein